MILGEITILAATMSPLGNISYLMIPGEVTEDMSGKEHFNYLDNCRYGKK